MLYITLRSAATWALHLGLSLRTLSTQEKPVSLPCPVRLAFPSPEDTLLLRELTLEILIPPPGGGKLPKEPMGEEQAALSTF